MVDVAVDDPAADWTAPGVYEVTTGVYRIPLPLPMDGLKAVNVYALVDGDDLVLIDSGWAISAARERLEAGLKALGRGFGDIKRFLVTHVHQDHYTQAVALRREFGGSIGLGEGERDTLSMVISGADLFDSPYLRRLGEAGAGPLLERLGQMGPAPQRDPLTWDEPDEWLTDRSTAKVGTRELVAIETPGHTRGHLVFRDDAGGVLFAGDHVLPHITPSIGFEAAPADFPLRDYLGSLRLVRSLPDTRLLPAHGPVTASAHRRVDELLEHHDERLDVIFGMVGRGASTAFEAATMMTWTRRERKLDELDPVNAMLAVLETMSHLDVLMLQGRVSMSEVDGVRHYRSA